VNPTLTGDLHLDLVAGFPEGDLLLKLAYVFHRLAIDRNDDVAGFKPRLLRG
jgi:hypothetical protein